MQFAFSADCKMNIKEPEKRDKYSALSRELKNPIELEGDSNTISIALLGTVVKFMVKRLKDLGKMCQQLSKYRITKIGSNTEKVLVT